VHPPWRTAALALAATSLGSVGDQDTAGREARTEAEDTGADGGVRGTEAGGDGGSRCHRRRGCQAPYSEYQQQKNTFSYATNRERSSFRLITV
jgi:hypothetical protein